MSTRLITVNDGREDILGHRTRDGHGLGPSMGWVGLNEKYCYFSLHLVFVLVLYAKKICK